jgi:hypothetical protein
LIVLVVTPFTAPFSACDLSMLIAAPHAAVSSIAAPGHDRASVEQASAQSITTSVLEEEQFKDAAPIAAVTVAPAFADGGRASSAPARTTVVRITLAALRL